MASGGSEFGRSGRLNGHDLRRIAPVPPLIDEPLGVLFGLPMPMAGAFGLRGTHLGSHRVRVAMPANPAYTNSRGDVHGGAISVLLDCTLASAARSHDPTAFGVATVDITIHYLAPVRGGVESA